MFWVSYVILLIGLGKWLKKTTHYIYCISDASREYHLQEKTDATSQNCPKLKLPFYFTAIG
jgi:hypothetical protein